MPRKPTADYTVGYQHGFDARDQRTIKQDIIYWNWIEWFLYVFTTMVVAAGVAIIFGLLTLWISWASDHRPHCRITADGNQWCTSD